VTARHGAIDVQHGAVLTLLAQSGASDAPSGLGHWLAAAASLVVLLALLVGLRWPAAQAAPIGLATAAIVAALVFDTPARTLAVAAGKGVWDAVFILLVVWPALLLFRFTERAGAQSALRQGLQRFSSDDIFIVMAFGWVFASFLQGISGFGAPIAVVAPLLVAIGVKPVLAVAMPLIGHAWANLFGTLGVAWLGTKQVIDFEDEQATAVQSALLLTIPIVLGGISVAWLIGRWAAIRHAGPMIAVISTVYAGGQLAIVTLDPVLAGIIPASLGLLALHPLSKWSRYAERNDDIEEIPALEDDTVSTDDSDAPMGTAMALLPYGVLTVAAVVALTVGPLRDVLESFELSPSFPAAGTDAGVENDAEGSYAPITLLTHPGIFLLLGTAAAAVAYRRRTADRDTDNDQPSLVGELASDAAPASVAIVCFLVMSSLMEHSGQIASLAAGIGDVAPPTLYASLAATIGAVGAFMTTSNTSSNVLFAPLQQAVAETQGLSESAIIAAQHAGGAIGNSVAPANIVLGTGTAGIGGEEGAVLRRVIPFALIALVVTGAATIALDAL
jgi:lactate permease